MDHEKGYLQVKIRFSGKITNFRVHRLVCMAYHGIPEGDLQVRHLDGSKDNNRPENLAWGTSKEDWEDRRRYGVKYTFNPQRYSRVKLSPKQAEDIRFLYAHGSNQRSLSEAYGVSMNHISRVVTGKIWRKNNAEAN